MSHDEEQARKDNQLFVRAQAKALGLPAPRQDRHEREGRGIAHVLLKLSDMAARPTDEELQEAIEEAKKTLRKVVTDKGGFVDWIECPRRINGDVEVRVMFTARRRTDA